MKIAFFISSLRMGGAERAVVKLANHWAAKEKEVFIITITDDAKDFYTLDKKIARIKLGLMEPRKTFFQKVRLQFKRMHALTTTIRKIKPDIVISFQTETNLLALETAPFHSVPVIISERTNIHMQKMKWIPAILRRLLYPLAQKIVFVSHGAANAYNWISKDKKAVIYNPVEPVETFKDGERTQEIVALGRLVKLKGYDLLIEAFSSLAAKHPAWNLKIYGEGPYRPDLENLISRYGLENCVFLPGATQNVPEVLSKAGIFVLSSRYEGMPNALMEAMSYGAPCISFDCAFGPSELIQTGQNGILVANGDVSELAQNISALINDAQKREAIGHQAQKINSDLAVDKITAQWEDLIRQHISI